MVGCVVPRKDKFSILLSAKIEDITSIYFLPLVRLVVYSMLSKRPTFVDIVVFCIFRIENRYQAIEYNIELGWSTTCNCRYVKIHC
jgi:hypothetical protein